MQSKNDNDSFFKKVQKGWNISLKGYYMKETAQDFFGIVESIVHTFPIEGRDHVKIVFADGNGKKYNVAFLCYSPSGKENDFSCGLPYCSGARLRLFAS